MRARLAALVVAALALAVPACAGSEDSSPASSGSAEGSTSEALAGEMSIELVRCAQLGTNTGVDPETAADYVLEGQDLYLDAAGSARFALITKSCDDIVVDGASVGPAHFYTAWVRITGPEETRTFDDPSVGLVTATDYFRPVLLQTDNAGYAEATQAFGIPMTLADELTFEDPQLGTQVVTSSDSRIDPPLSYTLTAENDRPFPDGVVGVVHVLEGVDGSGRSLTYEIECLAEGGFRGTATVAVDPGSSLDALLGTGFDGPANGPGINCEVTITRGS